MDHEADRHRAMPISNPPDPDEPARAVGKKLAEAAVASLPIVGGAAGVFMADAINSAYNRRLQDWLDYLAYVVRQLQERVSAVEDAGPAADETIDPLFVDRLLENDEFLDAIARATSVVGRDASRAKWALLQNALFNTVADPRALSADKRAIYLRYLSELTVTHVQVMALFHDPVGFLERQGKPWPDVYMGSFHSIVKAGLPQLAADTNLLESVIADLSGFGLISSPGMGTSMTAEGLRQPRSTAKGSEFAKFLRGPFDGSALGSPPP